MVVGRASSGEELFQSTCRDWACKAELGTWCYDAYLDFWATSRGDACRRIARLWHIASLERKRHKRDVQQKSISPKSATSIIPEGPPLHSTRVYSLPFTLHVLFKQHGFNSPLVPSSYHPRFDPSASSFPSKNSLRPSFHLLRPSFRRLPWFFRTTSALRTRW